MIVTSNKGFSFNKKTSPKAVATAIKFVIKKVLFIFLEITSNAKRIPARGLLNKAVTPAAIPAQINSVLYCLKTFCFRCLKPWLLNYFYTLLIEQ